MTGDRFAKLVDLARETDSGRRRELLHEVTDLFFATRGARSQHADAMFGDILQVVAAKMQDNVLIELANRFAEIEDAPTGLMRDLANHAFEIAEPVLRRSKALGDADLVSIVEKRSQRHIAAIAQRPSVSEGVSDAIVQRGDDTALGALLRNEGARFSRKGIETAVERARDVKSLHEVVVHRHDLPIDLLNEMYFVVETRLREQILKRNAGVDPATLDDALAKARARLSKREGELSDELKKAFVFVRLKRSEGALDGRLLIQLLRESQHARFLCALAEIVGVEVETVRQVVAHKDLDAIAMLCRAADVERAVFVSMAVLLCTNEQENAMVRGEAFGQMYNSVPVEAAKRAVRFFKVRAAAENAAAT
ncbi:MAG: DUF2336 domain-containing protein [Alphaproteobacteria bacterium]|nr:DUF2336 domain-containing protein [Alphaproteobacteria bacterium]